jgi:hypothetical protein
MSVTRMRSTSLERATQAYLGQEAARGARERHAARRHNRVVRVQELAAEGRWRRTMTPSPPGRTA